MNQPTPDRKREVRPPTWVLFPPNTSCSPRLTAAEWQDPLPAMLRVAGEGEKMRLPRRGVCKNTRHETFPPSPTSGHLPLLPFKATLTFISWPTTPVYTRSWEWREDNSVPKLHSRVAQRANSRGGEGTCRRPHISRAAWRNKRHKSHSSLFCLWRFLPQPRSHPSTQPSFPP